MSGIEDSREAIAAVDPQFAEAAVVMAETFDALRVAASESITPDLCRMVAAQLRMAADAFDGLTQRLEEFEARSS